MCYRRFLAVASIGLFALMLFDGGRVAAEGKMTRYVRFQAQDTVAYGIVEGATVRQLDGDLFGQWKPTDKTHELWDVKLLVPSVPSKVLAVAGNYKSHTAGHKWERKDPELFFKVPSCLIADGEKIVIPKGATNVHFEAELVIVIGRRAKNVPAERALDYVLGITCGNDVSARDWQKKDVQWWRAKGSDTFGPCGTSILSGIDYNDLLLELRVNGQVKQKERTSNMVHDVAEITSWASRFVTLQPGDLIYTGTPGKTSPIVPGDVVEVELSKVGILSNPVTAAE